MLPDTQTDVLRLADEYLRATGLRETALSSRIFGESKKLALLRGGSDLTVTRYRQVIQWFADNWPPEANWPTSLSRPEVVA